MGHVNFELCQDLLVGVLEVFQQLFAKFKLEVQSIFVSENFKGDRALRICIFVAEQVFVVRYSKVDPLVLVSPGGDIRENLRLASAAFAPEERACVVSFEAEVRRAAEFVGTP